MTQVLSCDPAAEAISSADIDRIAQMTDEFSGSDLHELCRAAAFGPVRDAVAKLEKAALLGQEAHANAQRDCKLRKLSIEDFIEVLKNTPTTQQQAKQ